MADNTQDYPFAITRQDARELAEALLRVCDGSNAPPAAVMMACCKVQAVAILKANLSEEDRRALVDELGEGTLACVKLLDRR